MLHLFFFLSLSCSQHGVFSSANCVTFPPLTHSGGVKSLKYTNRRKANRISPPLKKHKFYWIKLKKKTENHTLSLLLFFFVTWSPCCFWFPIVFSPQTWNTGKHSIIKAITETFKLSISVCVWVMIQSPAEADFSSILTALETTQSVPHGSFGW